MHLEPRGRAAAAARPARSTGCRAPPTGSTPPATPSPWRRRPTARNDGAHAYEFRALDGAGNASATGACTVRIDTSAPLTSAGGLQPDNHSGWRTTSQVVSLSADDQGGSGVASVTYTLDGGARHTYGAPFTVSGSGRHRVTYWAVDALGNLESPHTGYVNIDAVAPVTSAVGLSADDHSGWNTSAQTVLSERGRRPLRRRRDATTPSTAALRRRTRAAFTVTGDGRHQVTYWSVDGAGNVETAGSGYVNIDAAAPQTTAAGLQADAHSGWRTSDETVTLSAGDGSGSGVAATTYTVDGGAAQPLHSAVHRSQASASTRSPTPRRTRRATPRPSTPDGSTSRTPTRRPADSRTTTTPRGTPARRARPSPRKATRRPSPSTTASTAASPGRPPRVRGRSPRRATAAIASTTTP